MHPVLLQTPLIPIHSYGVLLMAAFLCAIGVLIVLGRKQGHSSDAMIEMALWAILVGLIGCRLGYVIQNLGRYSADPLSILNLRQGGMTLITGIIAGSIALGVYFHRKGIPFMNVLDLVSAPALIGMAVGRIGCVLHGCCFGKMCDASVAMALTYPNPNIGGPRYPSQLYELVLDLILMAMVIAHLPRRKFAGQAFWLTFGGYGLIRFCTEFFREGSLIGAFTLAQWTSLLFAFISLLGYLGVFGKQKVTDNLGIDEQFGDKSRVC